MRRKQKPRNKITQLDVIKSVRRMISKPEMVHRATKNEKHKWDWEDELDETEEKFVVGKPKSRGHPDY